MADISPFSAAVIFIVASLLVPRLFAIFKQQRKNTFTAVQKQQEIESVLEDATLTVSKEPDFPDDWLTSDKRLALERRAIFSKVSRLLFQT